MDNSKTEDAIEIAKTLKRDHMGCKQQRSIAAVTFYLLEGPSKKKTILSLFETTWPTLRKNYELVEDYKEDILPAKYH